MTASGKSPAAHIGDQAPDLNVQLEVFVNEATRKVMTKFSYKIDNLNSSPVQAVELAKALLTGAKKLDPATTEGITW